MTQPKVGSRQGLLENAGGQLVCPFCHTNEVWPEMVVMHTAALSVQLHTGIQTATVVGIEGDRQQADRVIDADLDFRCADGHGFGVHLVADRRGATIRTEWIEEPGEPSA